MKVSELIKALEGENPDSEVVYFSGVRWLAIKDISVFPKGYKLSSVGYTEYNTTRTVKDEDLMEHESIEHVELVGLS